MRSDKFVVVLSAEFLGRLTYISVLVGELQVGFQVVRSVPAFHSSF